MLLLPRRDECSKHLSPLIDFGCSMEEEHYVQNWINLSSSSYFHIQLQVLFPPPSSFQSPIFNMTYSSCPEIQFFLMQILRGGKNVCRRKDTTSIFFFSPVSKRILTHFILMYLCSRNIQNINTVLQCLLIYRTNTSWISWYPTWQRILTTQIE